MTQRSGVKGVWVGYYPDRSELTIFNSELEMLRTAVDRNMHAGFWPFGMDFSELEKTRVTLPEPLDIQQAESLGESKPRSGKPVAAGQKA